MSGRKTIQINPDHSFALYNLGVLLNELGDFKKASIYFLKAIEFESVKRTASVQYASTLLLSNQHLKALKIFAKNQK